jgi:hypothetical protein
MLYYRSGPVVRLGQVEVSVFVFYYRNGHCPEARGLGQVEYRVCIKGLGISYRD